MIATIANDIPLAELNQFYEENKHIITSIEVTKMADDELELLDAGDEPDEETTEEYLKRVEKEYEANNIIRHEHKNIDEFPDSIEISTPSKGGALKIYFNAMNREETEARIIAAFKARKFAQEELAKQTVE
jgi:hypothetical protein